MANGFDLDAKNYINKLASAELDISEEELSKIKREETVKRISEAVQQLIDTTNRGNKEELVEGLMDGFLRSHRYLQSEMWQVLLDFIKAYGEQEHFDARNGWAVDMCKRMHMAGYDPSTDEVLKKHYKGV